MARVVLLVLAAAILAPPGAYLAAILQASLGRHDWAEMDWSGDGRVTLGEAIHGSDVGRRVVERGGRDCVEFVEFKDGLAIRLDCPDP